jgi:hypothetical protein
MDSFKMIDEISLVEYSDEETGADSEQLESFRKFCEEHNSEGVLFRSRPRHAVIPSQLTIIAQ